MPAPGQGDRSLHAGAARRLAHKVLLRVARDDAYADRALDAQLERTALPSRDCALATEIVYGTLRHQPYVDYLISRIAARPLHKIAIPVLCALRMGAYQILETRVPAHAAVFESVSLVRSLTPRAAGFTNAVLRKLASLREADDLPRPEAEIEDPLAALAIRGSHPHWILQELAERIGMAEVEAWVEANNVRPPVSLRVNRLRSERDLLADQLRRAGLDVEIPASFPDGLWVSGGGQVRDWPGFADGSFCVQDLGAQLISRLAAPQAGAVALDACAAPGSKTTHLAELSNDTGRVIAVDVHAAKTRLIAAAAERLGLRSIVPTVADASDAEALGDLLFAHQIDGVDVAVVDAPCTGLGTLRRNPELRTRRQERLADLCRLQDLLLDAASSVVRPGGVLVYAVCTVTQAEGRDRIARFLAEHSDFSAEAPEDTALLPFVEQEGDTPVLRTWTHRDGADGFFAARMRRQNLARGAL